MSKDTATPADLKTLQADLVGSESDSESPAEPEGLGHVNADERPYATQLADPTGADGPSYEANQALNGRELNPGGSTDPHNTLSHVDSGEATE